MVSGLSDIISTLLFQVHVSLHAISFLVDGFSN